MTIYLRLPPVLKTAVKRAAKQAGLSVNMYIQRLLEQAVKQ